MDIIILNRDLMHSINLMKEISKLFKEYRVVYITGNADEFNDYIKSNLFDVVIMEEYFIESCAEIFKYNVHKICLLEGQFYQTTKYVTIKKDSKKALYDNLAKYITKCSVINADIKEMIRKELTYLGYNFSLRGTRYLEDAINLIYLKNCDCNLEKEVYSQLSKTYMKTAHSIKVNIQNSTNAMVAACGYNKVLKYLGIEANYGVGSKAIICAIINKINLAYSKNN